MENDIRKAQANKEAVVAVFFDIEKAYDMMWKEGLLIKIDKMSIGGKLYNWIKDVLFGGYIQVRVGNSISDKFFVENGTSQGSVKSSTVFNHDK